MQNHNGKKMSSDWLPAMSNTRTDDRGLRIEE